MNWFQKKMAGHSSSCIFSFLTAWILSGIVCFCFAAIGMLGIGVVVGLIVEIAILMLCFSYHLRCQGLYEETYGCLPEDRFKG